MEKRGFNVNFLGNIPYSFDSLHIPSGLSPKERIEKIDSNQRIIGFTLNQMMEAYWTVRSFEVSVGITVTDTVDPVSIIVSAGGQTSLPALTAGSIIAAEAIKVGLLNKKGHTKIFSKYEIIRRNEVEGIIKNKTQKDRGGDAALDVKKDPEPYILNSHIYKPNEGTLCSAGPVHMFTGENCKVVLDFSDIKYLNLSNNQKGPAFYYPKTLIYAAVPTAGAAFSNMISPLSLIRPNFTLLPKSLAFINLNVKGAVSNRGPQLINSQMYFGQIANVNIDIKPGKRCCDRFYWDGADEKREKGELPNPNLSANVNNDEPCKDVCKDEEKGVYSRPLNKGEERTLPD
jgi:hypothetical protein